MTRIGWNSKEQVRDWRSLMEAIDDLPFADVPCQNDPDLFFMEDAQNPIVSNRRAKQACASCPVKVLCAEYAIKHHEEFGIWGGLTPSERKLLRAERNRGDL